MQQEAPPTLCLTIDVEPDFVSLDRAGSDYGLFDDEAAFARFCEQLGEIEGRVTCFVVGQVLEDRPACIRELDRLGVEFACHSRTHDLRCQDSESEVRGGIQHFAEFFGRLPRGYRSPRGVVTPQLLTWLDKEGVEYDSSVIPSYRPGVYSHLDKPTSPFRWEGFSLIEIPMGVVPRVRIPLAMSYMKLTSWRLQRLLLESVGVPDPAVFLFHPMDLRYSDEAFRTMPQRWRLAYGLNRGGGWAVLEGFVGFMRKRGARLARMSELLPDLQSPATVPAENV